MNQFSNLNRLLTLLFVIICLGAQGQPGFKTENVILVTLDGMRWQEVFGGAESRLIAAPFVSDSVAVIRDFWAETLEKRRERLMPFLWKNLVNQGQIYGNRKYDNLVNVSNQQWFSYPGYNELLCGFADDERVTSNEMGDNPNITVLEFLNQQSEFKGKVAAYASWKAFPFIINSRRSGIPVNAGIVPAKTPNEKEKVLNDLLEEVPNPLGDVRLDAFTFHYGFEFFKKNKPRVMMFAFDETDDFAHRGNYEEYLRSANHADKFIKTLWDWCQSDPSYKDKTTMIITCDHGRGSVSKDDWRDHGKEMANSDQIWIAVIGPDSPVRGEVKMKGKLFQNQIAKTLTELLGINYKNRKPVGNPIDAMIGR